MSEDTPRTVFHYIKNGAFRTLHVDGAIGSVAPSGHIHCSVYSERPAIPRQVEYQLTPSGEPTGEGEVLKGKSGYVRELEVDLVMSPDVARALAKWLILAADAEEKMTTSSVPRRKTLPKRKPRK